MTRKQFRKHLLLTGPVFLNSQVNGGNSSPVSGLRCPSLPPTSTSVWLEEVTLRVFITCVGANMVDQERP